MTQITNGSSVSVNYTGRLEDGTIFDTSLHEGRTPLTATLGQGQLIPGFENIYIILPVTIICFLIAPSPIDIILGTFSIRKTLGLKYSTKLMNAL